MTETSRPRTSRPSHPMHPLVMDGDSVRFKKNAIIDHLFNTGALDLNALAVMGFSDEDRMQVAQLLGYSVSRFGDLPYADPEVVAVVDAQVDVLFTDDHAAPDSAG